MPTSPFTPGNPTSFDGHAPGLDSPPSSRSAPPSFAPGSAAAAEIGLCLLLAAADGEISEQELAALTDRVGVLLGDDFDPLELGLIVDRELRAIDELGTDGYIAKLKTRIALPRRSPALYAACAVACADGLSKDEEAVVRDVASALEITTGEVEMAIEAGDDDRLETIPAPTRPIGGEALDDEHEDEPNEWTRLIAERLEANGWIDPNRMLRGAGIHIESGGSGALTREYQAPEGRLLRLEHHTCDGSVRVQVTDDSDDVLDLHLVADGREPDLLALLVRIQNDLSVGTIDVQLPELLGVSRVFVARDGERVELGRPE